MKFDSQIKGTDVTFYNVRQAPFELYGFYDPLNQSEFKRLPDDIGTTTCKGVSNLYKNTAGGRVRFSTDSKYIAIKALMPNVCRLPHLSLLSSAGFSLYIDDPDTGESRFWGVYKPPIDMTDGYESKIHFSTSEMRCFTIYFPTYSDVSKLYVGIDKGARLEKGMAYKNISPIIYYGSSITQGASASHPGNAYESIIGRHINTDFINLGFSASAHGEEILAKYMSTLDMSMFVCDYDHNSPDPQALEETHFRLYKIIRDKHPDIPYIMITRPDFPPAIDRRLYENNVGRRIVIMDSYLKATRLGDKNVYFIDGSNMFKGQCAELCTADGVHPNDLGFHLMAEAIEHVIKSII